MPTIYESFVVADLAAIAPNQRPPLVAFGPRLGRCPVTSIGSFFQRRNLAEPRDIGFGYAKVDTIGTFASEDRPVVTAGCVPLRAADTSIASQTEGGPDAIGL